MSADEAKRLRTISHEAMLAGRDPWPARAQAGDTAAAAGLGKYFYLRHQRSEAEHWFEQAVASGDDPEGCYNLGVMRREDGRAAELAAVTFPRKRLVQRFTSRPAETPSSVPTRPEELADIAGQLKLRAAVRPARGEPSRSR